jgi:pimeloyl-ACP methyl ester carboxylesterase/DNA-binding CsgD family transcriptional regulator
VRQNIRFCTASDGARIAYAVHGRGPPLVRAATWLTHLEYDWESPVWRHWLEGLGARHTLIRYDERGCGLSDRDVRNVTADQWVDDLATVIDAAGLEQCALLGISQGAPIAVAYAARNPDRVSRLLLYGGYARGRAARGPAERRQNEALVSLISAAWSDPNPTFRRLFTMLYIPEGSPEQMRWFDELQDHTASAEHAARLYAVRGDVDVTGIAPGVEAPALVLHARGDRVVPFGEGRLLATLLPSARLMPLDSANHILLADEPAWARFLTEAHAFLGTSSPPPASLAGELSAREMEVLELVAGGLSNAEIAARLFLSVRTVERHLSNTYAKLRVSGKAARAAAAARYAELARADLQRHA